MIEMLNTGLGDRRRRAVILLAPVVMFALSAVIGFGKPGLQYDEALFQEGAVQMLTSPTEPSFAHDPGSWFELGGRSWPLMVIPYIGAISNYALVPVFAVAGTGPAPARIFGSVLGALGLLGLVVGASEFLGPGAAAAAGAILAIHPNLILNVLYDNNDFEWWMACLGGLAIALGRYARRRDRASAFWAGLAAGAGIWSRGNFVWLVVPLGAAILLVYGKPARAARAAWLSAAAGGIVGALPLMMYEVSSGFATVRFLRTQGTAASLDRLGYRLGLLRDAFLCDINRTWIWGGDRAPRGPAIVISGIVLGALISALVPRRRAGSADVAARVVALTCLGYLGFVLTSRLNVAGHHLVPLVPLAALLVVGAARRLPAGRQVRGAAAVGALLYMIVAGREIARTARGVRATGGVGMWSDAVVKVAGILEKQYPRRDVYYLDWGFRNNIFVLSRGAITSREPFWNETAAGSGFDLDPSAVYVTHSPRLQIYRAAASAFLRRLATFGEPVERTSVFQRNGEPYADVYAFPDHDPPSVSIASVSPARIVAGVGFNVQPSGDSAITVSGSGFRLADQVWWNERALTTTFESSAFLSAEVPRNLFDGTGIVRITIRHGIRPEPGALAKIRVVAR